MLKSSLTACWIQIKAKILTQKKKIYFKAYVYVLYDMYNLQYGRIHTIQTTKSYNLWTLTIHPYDMKLFVYDTNNYGAGNYASLRPIGLGLGSLLRKKKVI